MCYLSFVKLINEGRLCSIIFFIPESFFDEIHYKIVAFYIWQAWTSKVVVECQMHILTNIFHFIWDNQPTKRTATCPNRICLTYFFKVEKMTPVCLGRHTHLTSFPSSRTIEFSIWLLAVIHYKFTKYMNFSNLCIILFQMRVMWGVNLDKMAAVVLLNQAINHNYSDITWP